MQFRLFVAPVRAVVFDSGPLPGFGWSCFTAVEGESPAGTVDGRRAHDRQRARSAHRRRRDRHVRARGRRRARRRARPARRRRRRRRHVQLLPARARRRDRHAGRGARHDPRNGAGARADPHRIRIRVAGRRGRRRAGVQRAVRGNRAGPGRDHARTPGRGTVPAGRARDRQPTRAITACAPISRCRRPCRAPTPSARSRWCTADSPPRAERTSSASRRFRRAASSTRPTATSGSRSVHDGLLEYEVVDEGRELALTLLRATGYLSRIGTIAAAEPGGSDRSRRRARKCRAASAPTTRCCSIGATGARPTVTARPTRSSSPASAPGCREPRRATVPPRAPPCASTAPRFRPCCAPRAASPCASSAAQPTAGTVTIEHEGVPARGWVVDLRGRPVNAFEGEVTLDPWQLATLQLA